MNTDENMNANKDMEDDNDICVAVDINADMDVIFDINEKNDICEDIDT